jgi:hypothetical protein
VAGRGARPVAVIAQQPAGLAEVAGAGISAIGGP